MSEEKKKTILFHVLLGLIAAAGLIVFFQFTRGLTVSTVNRRRLLGGAVLAGTGWIVLFLRFHFLYRLKYKRPEVRRMNRRKLFDRLPLYVLWALAAALITLGVFLRAVDKIPAEKRLIVFIDTAADSQVLAERLDQVRPETLQWLDVRDDSYTLFRAETMLDADIWILKASHLENMAEYLLEGRRLLIYSAAGGSGAAKDYIDYLAPVKDENGESYIPEPEDYYIVFSKASLHTGAEGTDEAAFAVAEELMKLP